MENEFVTYEQALALKELGFEWQTLNFFDSTTRDFWNWDYFPDINAPLKQQVFRWFREKYNIIGIIEGGYTEGKNVFSYVIWQGHLDDWTDAIFNTYEEAENRCIDKLIEIAKQQYNGYN
jgi:hypothetical protein